MLVCVSLGFASGLPLFIIYNLLSAWLRASGVDLKAIGLFALVGFPYTWKFVWSPLMDRFCARCGAAGATAQLDAGDADFDFGRRVCGGSV